MKINYTKAQIDFLAKARQFALDNLEVGGDIIYECYDDAELLELETLEEVKFVMECQQEKRIEIMSTRW